MILIESGVARIWKFQQDGVLEVILHIMRIRYSYREIFIPMDNQNRVFDGFNLIQRAGVRLCPGQYCCKLSRGCRITKRKIPVNGA